MTNIDFPEVLSDDMHLELFQNVLWYKSLRLDSSIAVDAADMEYITITMYCRRPIQNPPVQFAVLSHRNANGNYVHTQQRLNPLIQCYEPHH